MRAAAMRHPSRRRADGHDDARATRRRLRGHESRAPIGCVGRRRHSASAAAPYSFYALTRCGKEPRHGLYSTLRGRGAGSADPEVYLALSTAGADLPRDALPAGRGTEILARPPGDGERYAVTVPASYARHVVRDEVLARRG